MLEFKNRDHFRLKDEYFEWLHVGRKSTTIRHIQSGIDVPESLTLPIYSEKHVGGEKYSSVVRIQSFTVKPFSELSEADADNDGFESLAELEVALLSIYPTLAPNELVTVYSISLENRE